MAYNHPFWEFVRNLDAQQRYEHPAGAAPQPQEPGSAAQEPAGPDPAQFTHPFAAFFGPPQHPHFGGRGQGRHRGGFRHGGCPAMNPDAAQPPSSGPEETDGEPQGPQGPHFGHHHRGRHYGRRGWAHGAGYRGPPGYAAFGGPHTGAPFDFSAMIDSLSSHPIAVALRNYVDEATRAAAAGANTDPNTAPNESSETLINKDNEETEAFSPALDIFSTPTSYVLHVALPGAQKEDVGVNWDAEKSELNIAGVVYRAGDEKFIEALKKKERRVGMFERSVKLPLEGEEKVEINSDDISAKLEDGVLVITVGKVEKEETWTDLKRVNIE